MKMKNIKNMWKYLFVAAIAGMMTVFASCGISGTDATSPATTSYVQIERLARPAVNEGLVLSNANLNAFNSIPPSLDLDSSITAVAAVQGEAVTVINVVRALGTAAGGTPPATGDVVAQFLPDVTRISVDDAHYGTLHNLAANVDRTSNSRQGEVGYTACVSVTSGAPLLCGGRKIRDDVIDITLSYIALGAGAAAPGASDGAVVSYTVTDQVGYTTAHPASNPLLATFPFLALPL
jgi:hypothetical protein